MPMAGKEAGMVADHHLLGLRSYSTPLAEECVRAIETVLPQKTLKCLKEKAGTNE
jgi:hypothetical protein